MDDGAKSSISKESHPSKNEEEDDDNQEVEKTHELFLLWYTVLVSRPQLYPLSIVFLWRAIAFI